MTKHRPTPCYLPRLSVYEESESIAGYSAEFLAKKALLSKQKENRIPHTHRISAHLKLKNTEYLESFIFNWFPLFVDDTLLLLAQICASRL